jgi:hypothetical protein
MTTERRNEASKFEYLDPLEVLTDLGALRRAVSFDRGCVALSAGIEYDGPGFSKGPHQGPQ